MPIYPKKEVPAKLLAALMNSTPVLFFIEVIGRVVLGDGLLDTPAEEAKFYMIVPDATQLDASEAKAITNAFDKLAKRDVLPLKEEIKQADRKALDVLVLEALGLPNKILPQICAGILGLTEERLKIAGMRNLQAAGRIERDTDKILAEVVEDVLPDGAKHFPDAFWPQGFNERKPNAFKEINVTGKPFRLGHAMLMQQEVIDSDGQVIVCPSRAEAEFLVHAVEPHHYVLRIPADKFVLEKTVAAYLHYVGDLEKQFLRKFGERTLNHAEAETLTRRALETLSPFSACADDKNPRPSA